MIPRSRMRAWSYARSFLLTGLCWLLVMGSELHAQGSFPFTSGPIPQCDTSAFTANVSGVGVLEPGGSWFGLYLESIEINITSDHPETLEILLTSPQGTTIVLSAFNGAGGQNYTSTLFPWYGGSNITSGSAPFSGSWWPQNGSLGSFDYENANGTWTVTVIDTACANGGGGPNGTWTPGWFDGGGGSGIAFGVSAPPPCMNPAPDGFGVVCPGGTVDILGYYLGWDPSWTYEVFDGNYIPVADPTAVSQPGFYNVEAYDPWDGCLYYVYYDLQAGAAPNLGPDQLVNDCGGAQTNLTALFPLAGLTTSWTFNGSAIPSATAASASQSGTYTVVATNAGGCSDTAEVVLDLSGGATLGPDQNVQLCQGNTTDLTTLFATGGLTTAWTLGGAPVADPTAVGVPGQYMLVATSLNLCSDTALVDVAVSLPPALGPDQQVSICAGGSEDLTAFFGTAGLATSWASGGMPVPDPAAVFQAGTYQLVATDGIGCSDTALITLDLDTVPALGPDQSVAICSGEVLDLTPLFPSAGLFTEWTQGGAPVADPTSVSFPGGYQYVAVNGAGCSDTASVMLSVNMNPSPGADASFALCPWQTVDLTTVYSLQGLTATYALDGLPVADPTQVADSGNYVVTVTDVNGCTGSAMAEVVQVDCLCEADFTVDARCLQEPAYFTLVADSAILGAQWDFGGVATPAWAVDPVVQFEREGMVEVTVIAELSCGVDTLVRMVPITDCSDSCSLFIPSAFTPDGDAVNDRWGWTSECVPEDFQVEVFDRWGELVFSARDPYHPWDGSSNGGPLRDGTYPYRIRYRLPYQDTREVTGTVTLVR